MVSIPIATSYTNADRAHSLVCGTNNKNGHLPTHARVLTISTADECSNQLVCVSRSIYVLVISHTSMMDARRSSWCHLMSVFCYETLQNIWEADDVEFIFILVLEYDIVIVKLVYLFITQST